MYEYHKTTTLTYEATVQKTRAALQQEGFGVLTEIDVKATLKKKLDVNFDNYIILGACNPPFAYRALQAEKNIGLMLPCNIIVYEQQGTTHVAAILPTAAMQITGNKELMTIATEVEKKLKKSLTVYRGEKMLLTCKQPS